MEPSRAPRPGSPEDTGGGGAAAAGAGGAIGADAGGARGGGGAAGAAAAGAAGGGGGAAAAAGAGLGAENTEEAEVPRLMPAAASTAAKPPTVPWLGRAAADLTCRLRERDINLATVNRLPPMGRRCLRYWVYLS